LIQVCGEEDRHAILTDFVHAPCRTGPEGICDDGASAFAPDKLDAMPYLELNKESIATLVHTFYDEVRADPVLAPVFSAAIGDHWEPHLERMVSFWATTMLKTQSFQGNVFGKHMALNGITPDHFQRWLTMFEATAARLFAPEAADEFALVARRIAASLQFGFFGKVVVSAGGAN
jgi:hemoglobin